ncbi:MAG: hypothetical protein JSW20_07495 [Nitrospiraceae bacterium]|nr:MAG: hypothetical protein JSW20_07495 [Nitrospiraceae bacterium]
MKTVKKEIKYNHLTTWEEESGFLEFLTIIPDEVARFNETFGFDIHNLVNHPSDIDGDRKMAVKLGFVLERYNPLIPELTYCLYSLLSNGMLHGYIGIYKNGSITTLREMKPIKDYKRGQVVLHEWLGKLVKASCEKIMP